MLYRDISGRQEDAFLNNYVESVFRAFDADRDAQLTFREWQVGFYLLLLLPTVRSFLFWKVFVDSTPSPV